ncbi:GDSL esterase/lipase At2g04570-like [Papaver somniferum]|uniref:GDSL esterase/lipase At2g04570-like n=1 Tax=Papaver somniferum TaxID=3469 RepID=UPI000E7047C7|nr:GDSL esterase/lipase At2g04570-like [Papaver somniferum]
MAQCSRLLCLLHILLLFVVEIIEAKRFPACIVFGDSTVDAGNNNQIPTVVRANFPPYGQDCEGGKPNGRFCNGRLATDFLSEMLGIKRSIPAYLDPAYDIEDFASGVTFASAGTGYDVATSNVFGGIPLSKELEYFKEYQKKLIAFVGQDKAIETIRESLYMVSVRTNDFLENYHFGPVRSIQFTVDEYANFLISIARTFLTDLYGLGARKILSSGIPPAGCIPIARTVNNFAERTCKEDANEACKDFNDKLQNLVGNLNKELDGIILITWTSIILSWISFKILNYTIGERA